MSTQQTAKAHWLAENLKAGEIYAGILLGNRGAPDQHIILLPGYEKSIKWVGAKTWAKKIGGELPTRREQSLLFANIPEEFEPGYYWSSEQYAGCESSAWFQRFGDGDQNYYHKNYELRARAVRRLIL